MSATITTRVSVCRPNAGSCTNAANVPDQVTLQQTVDEDSLLQLQQQVPQWTPVKADLLEALLQGHPNQSLVHEVVTGFRQGFKLKYHGPHEGQIHHNLKSAFQYPKLLQQYLDKGVKLNRMLGPFTHKTTSKSYLFSGNSPKEEF